MAVEIDLDLDASGATGKIGAVAASLKGLERVADDIDIDFDADIGDITDEIEDFADALNDIEVGNIGFIDDLDKVADKLDDALEGEIDLSFPGGNEGGNDSDGTIPPDLVTNLSEIANEVPTQTSTASATDGGDRANLLERTYGDHVLMGESDVGDLFKTRNSRLSNLGASSPDFELPHQMKRLGTQTGFGLDPESMNLRRMASDLSMEDFMEAANPQHGADTGGAPQFEDLVRDFRQITLDHGDLIQEQERLFKQASAPIETPFGDRGLNFDKRMSELTTEELNELMENPAQSGDGFIGGDADSSLIDYDEIGETLRENRETLRAEVEDGVSSFDFTDLNKGARREAGLSFGELQPDIDVDPMEMEMGPPERDNAPGLDFSVGGGRRGRSNVDLIDNNRILSKVDSVESLGDAFGALGNVQSSFGKKLRKLKPTMGKYMQLFAALIPIAVALGTQLLGVAAAMGSVAVAGGAIMGLGLLGHAESMSGSIAEAKEQLRTLKQEMFETFQPTMQQFAPIQSQMFDAMPEGMDSIAESMEELTVYKDTLFELGSALSGGFEEAIDIIVENEAAISDLTTDIGGLIGSGLLNFFEWLIRAASENKQLLISLGQEMIKLAVAAYNVSMAISQVLTAFTPLFNLLVFISEVLNSQIIIGLITMVGWLYVLGKAAGMIYALYGGFMTLASGIADATLMMFGYEMSTWGAVAATLALVAAIGLLTLGAATVIGGAVTAGAMGGSGVPSGPNGDRGGMGTGNMGGDGSTTVYNDNRSYEINNGGRDDYASQKAMEDTVKKVSETSSAQSLPDVETSSDDSEGKSN